MIRTKEARTQILRSLTLLLLLSLAGTAALADGETAPARDPKQPVDDAYTAKIKKYTTQPFFTSPLVDHLPKPYSVTSPARPGSYPTPKTSTNTCASSKKRVRA